MIHNSNNNNQNNSAHQTEIQFTFRSGGGVLTLQFSFEALAEQGLEKLPHCAHHEIRFDLIFRCDHVLSVVVVVVGNNAIDKEGTARGSGKSIYEFV